MPPAGFRGDCIIATRAVSGQTTAFYISESGELCPLYFSADFRIIFTICTCIGFFPCCWEKLHFSSNLDLQFFHIANVVKIKFYSFFFSFFPGSIFCLNSKVNPSKSTKQCHVYYRYFLHKLLAINGFHGIVRYCNGEVRTPQRQEITARKETEMSNRLDDEKIRTEELFKALQ